MSLIGALTKAAKAGEAAKKTAPFYSAVDEALANIARPKGTGAEFFTELSKQPGVKKAELADRKLEQAFKAKGKITKEEAQQILKENPPPKLSERKLTEITDDMREAELRDKIQNSGYDKWSEVPSRTLQRWNDEIDYDMEKFSQYALSGGKNYREILLKLPKLETKDVDKNFWSVHYLDDPNVLAHMRVQDRVGPNGEKVLHIEEIQSDWHQRGRDKGYKPDDYIEQSNALEQQFKELGKKRADLFQEAERIGYRGEGFHDLIEQGNSITPKLMQLQEQRDNLQNAINYGVPDAPFKKNWHELAMKRLLNYAADNGYDSVAITPGVEQAKRYPRQNEADKIAQEQGMSGFYDKILPDYLNNFGKQYGARVEQMPIDVGGFKVNRDNNPLPYRLERTTSPDVVSRFATADEAWAEAEKLGSVPLHSFKITPEMREAIKQKGLPLYQQIGIPTAGAGAASQMPEPEEGLAGGGIVNSLAKTEALAKLAKLREQMAPRAEAVQNLMKMDENRYLRDVVPNSLTNAEIEAEIQRMAARAKAAGQQEGVLPMAQRDANLAKFLEESQIKDKLYRGQRRAPKADRFITTQGRATPSFTDNPDVANVYSQQLGWDIAHGPGSTSVPVHVQMKMPFDIRSLGEHVTLEEFLNKLDHDLTVPRSSDKIGYEDLADILGTLDYHVYKGNAKHNIDATDNRGTFRVRSFEQLADEVNNAGRKKNISRILDELLPDATIDTYALADSPEVVKQLKKLGYDSMIHKDVFDAGMPHYKGDPSKIGEGYDADHIIDAYRPFEQSKIKSAIGNRGTYDINDPDITKAIGGSVKRQVKKADGGAINFNTAPDMSDGGRIIEGAPFKHGGKVKVTTNRDAMFMELSNKKLKRK